MGGTRRAKVIVLGGGIAGLTAAHELAARDFEVVVYERRPMLGGKARSMKKDDGLAAGLPSEHGFRFFPGFYRHVIDTMRATPSGDGERTVADHLVGTKEAEFAGTQEPPIVVPDRFPTSPSEVAQLLEGSRRFLDLGIPPEELAFFSGKLLTLLTSCDERRFKEWEHTSWWDFVGARSRSWQYRQYLADGMTRKMVAAHAREMSTRTCGYILLQLMNDFATPGKQMDRVLDGPTNDVWIDPWRDYLEKTGRVDFQCDTEVAGIACDDGKITAIKLANGEPDDAEYYVGALSVTRMWELLSENGSLLGAAPKLRGLGELQNHVRWMAGIQFYLCREKNRRVPLVEGHVVYIDSPYSLTSISEAQFWPEVNLPELSRGKVTDILSVDISDWMKPGPCGKPAKELKPEEIRDEVWKQLEQALNHRGARLKREDLVDVSLDSNIIGRNPDPKIGLVNLAPMLVNAVGTWGLRPEAVTEIPNFFLAGDYVRTYTDLACMEGANEAARRAVNGILGAAGIDHEDCRVWKLSEPAVFRPLKALDEMRFQMNLPHISEGVTSEWGRNAARFASQSIALGLDALRGLGSSVRRQRATRAREQPRPKVTLPEQVVDLTDKRDRVIVFEDAEPPVSQPE
jgi:uncharacterized protein with NAD-binding domain and iron-sulfur cluster